MTAITGEKLIMGSLSPEFHVLQSPSLYWREAPPHDFSWARGLIEEKVVVLVNRVDIFMGWVQVMDELILYDRVKDGQLVKADVVESFEFRWKASGGMCYSGQLKFRVVDHYTS